MSWRVLWRRLMFRNFRAYAGYVLIFSVAVTIFYLFQTLSTGLGSASAIQRRDYLTDVIGVMRGIVFVFALFFVAYFHRLLLLGESRALGLLGTFGMSRHTRRGLVLWESILLGTAGLTLGLALGLLLEPLFLLAAGVFLRLPWRLAYEFRPQLLLLTALAFAVLVLLEGGISAELAVRRWPRQLLSASRAVEEVRQPSRVRAILGLILLAAAYLLAAVIHPRILERYTEEQAEVGWLGLWLLLTPIILLLTLLGSYWLLAEGLRLLLRHRLVAPGSRAESLLARARLGARLRAHAGSGAIIAGLLAFVVTDTCMLIGVQAQVLRSTLLLNPVVVQITHPENDEAAIDAEAQRIASSLSEAGFGPVQAVRLRLVLGATPLLPFDEDGLAHFGHPRGGWYTDRIKGVNIIAHSAYTHLIGAIEVAHPSLTGIFPAVPELQPGQAFAIRTRFEEERRGWNDPAVQWLSVGRTFNVLGYDVFRVAPEEVTPDELARAPLLEVTLVGRASTAGLPTNMAAGFVNQTFLVVDDATFSALETSVREFDPESIYSFTGLFYPRWRDSQAVLMRLLPDYPVRMTSELNVQPLPLIYAEQYREFGVLLFTLSAIALLFLFASGAVIHFKVSERLESDVRQVTALRRVGATKWHVRGIFVREAAVLLLAPFLLGMVHSAVALIDWVSMLDMEAVFDRNFDIWGFTYRTFLGMALGIGLVVAVYGGAVIYRYAGRIWDRSGPAARGW
ncbi:FtsX-like permease family protein [Thermomicrobiaceae bacterium CFH 74404]|uniref:FtsX-like permease family protein n=1 Tax=Thermalbibacter longus TaxID=2951981 RepID=A0AA41WDA8_9BACT|nr:FtsX-like permease family protein [Thermalbibacter longus]MCM8747935.1 FtsX-like permease family protein [Thermalbibacter longus]